MTCDPERIHKDRIVQDVLSEKPWISPKLLSAAIRIPRAPFFPGEAVDALFSDRRQSGWGGRPAPTVKETLLILGELLLQPGDRVAVYRPTDPYFLLLLLEMTHRVTLVEENGEIRQAIQGAMSDLGHAYIRFSSSTDGIKDLPDPFRYVLFLGDPEGQAHLEAISVPPSGRRIWRLSDIMERVSPRE